MILRLIESDGGEPRCHAGIDLGIMASGLCPYLESRLPAPFESCSVALSFVSNEDIMRLNDMYRHVQEPTDVLSFPLWEEEGVFAPLASWSDLPLGDIVISPEYVRENAKRVGAGYEGELALVIIHGFLHLIGFDHDTDEREREMWEIQEKLRDDYLASTRRPRARREYLGGLMLE